MKIVHVSYSVSQSSANTRLHIALIKSGIESKVLTLEGSTDLKEVYQVKCPRLLAKIYSKCRWALQVAFDTIFVQSGMPYHMGTKGVHIEKEELIKEADLVHLHWVCDFVSPYSIAKILSMGKPVVWTCHDSWPITGGCNVKYDCIGFQCKCSDCAVMKRKYGSLISKYVWKNKERYLQNRPVKFIAPSNWTAGNILKSSLFGRNKCYVVPNAIDTEIYNDITTEEIKENLDYVKDTSKIHILFGATSIKIPYKGFEYLMEVMTMLREQHGETASKIVLHILGDGVGSDEILDKYECKYWGYVEDERKKACIYNLVDLLVYPSLEDSLSYIVMESLACSTPVVIFNTGGIPDLVEHKRNGYIASYRDSKDFLKGLLWCLENNKDNVLGCYGKQKVQKMCALDVIAEKHIKIYEESIRDSRRDYASY